MNGYGWRRPSFLVAFGVLALLVLVAALFLPPFVRTFYPFGFFRGFIFFFLFFGAFRWFFWGWGWRRGYGYYGGHDDRAHRILRERYARGEITKEQLDQMMRDLDQHTQATRSDS